MIDVQIEARQRTGRKDSILLSPSESRSPVLETLKLMRKSQDCSRCCTVGGVEASTAGQNETNRD